MLDFLQSVGISTGWTVIGVLLLFGSTVLFDRITPLNYRQEIHNGNVAAAVVIAAIILSMGAIAVANLAT
ncbi:MAG: DUF350 domain-containing protein [Cyanobacteria bacterium QS_8_64_29]|nr:MAG: DUF350 domain-containing protein [Cyanobacteria bacterium QS_8_64_29]